MQALDIANRALAHLGLTPILDLYDTNDDPKRVYALQHLPWALAKVGEETTWACMSTRVLLAPLATPPAFEYQYSFQLPSDFLRPGLFMDASFQTISPDYSIEGRQLLTNVSSLYMIYVRRLELSELGELRDYVAQLIALAMAESMAPLLIEPTTKKAEEKAAEYRFELPRAKVKNSREFRVYTLGSSTWTNAMDQDGIRQTNRGHL